jgi:histidyl-tRNA synthetase
LHAIAKDKLGGQINTAAVSGAPYIILVGQKEALENSVIIRNSANHAQEIVPIPNLAIRAKELIKSIK